MSHFEKDAIISGLGISRIGRRTGIPGAELTMEAVRAAIDDAGLTPADIDGIATFGDTPVAEVVEALGIQSPISVPASAPAGCSFRSCRRALRYPRSARDMSWSTGPSRCWAGR